MQETVGGMKALRAQDMRIGDYVQAYSKITRRFAMPMYVDSIFGEDTVYLNFVGNEADPWEENQEDVYPVEISDVTLEHFGFKKKKGEWQARFCGYKVIVVPVQYSNYLNVVVTAGFFWRTRQCRYVHEMQHFFYEEVGEVMMLEWR